MKPLIKWPGGKSSELKWIRSFIPKNFNPDYHTYVEPFFGGGAVFFHLQPKQAIINDNSELLTQYYCLIKDQDKLFKDYLLCYSNSFSNLINLCQSNIIDILNSMGVVFEIFFFSSIPFCSSGGLKWWEIQK